MGDADEEFLVSGRDPLGRGQPERTSAGVALSEGFRADIEGLRGLAILLVVAYHAGLPGFGGGYVGVDVFFVLSGYLITGLLTSEWATTGRIDFWRFYARRARRLIPAAAAMLVVVVLVAWWSLAPWEVVGVAGSARGAAAYLSNVRFALSATDYLRAPLRSDLFLHTWSLSVEEQFYLLWPLLILLALGAFRGRNVGLLALLSTTGLASLLGCIMLTQRVQPWAFFLLPTRWWEFSLGAATRVATTGQHRGRIATGWFRWIPPAGLAGICFSAVVFDDSTVFPGIAAIAPALGTAGALVGTSNLARSVLDTRGLRGLGRVSYALYLWHWPLLAFAVAWGTPIPWWGRTVLVGASLALAWASTRFLEAPVRRSGWLGRRPRTTVLASLALMGTTFVGATLLRRHAEVAKTQPPYKSLMASRGDLPSVYSAGCVLPPLEVQLAAQCVYGSSRPRASIVLFGDSHAAQWFPAIDALARKHGWKVTVLTKSSCPASSVAVFIDVLKRGFSECDRWREIALARINAIKPDLVLMSGYDGYAPADPGMATTITASAWRAGYRKSAKATMSARSVVIIADIPRLPFDPATCLARQLRFGRWASRCELNVGTVPAVAAHRLETRDAALWEVDMTEGICSGRCSISRSGAAIYRDAHHLTATFAASLAPLLEQRLRSAGVAVVD